MRRHLAFVIATKKFLSTMGLSRVHSCDRPRKSSSSRLIITIKVMICEFKVGTVVTTGFTQ